MITIDNEQFRGILTCKYEQSYRGVTISTLEENGFVDAFIIGRPLSSKVDRYNILYVDGQLSLNGYRIKSSIDIISVINKIIDDMIDTVYLKEIDW